MRTRGFGHLSPCSPCRCYCGVPPSAHGQAHKENGRLAANASRTLSLLSGPLPSASVWGKNRGEGRVKLSGLGGGGWIGSKVGAAPRPPRPIDGCSWNSRRHPKKAIERKAPSGGKARRAQASRSEQAGRGRSVLAGRGRGDAPLVPAPNAPGGAVFFFRTAGTFARALKKKKRK